MKRFIIILLSIFLFSGVTTKIALADTNYTKDIVGITMENINEILRASTEINSIIEGKTQKQDIDKINIIISDMLEGSHEMPAFGVSLDNETRMAKQSGTWIELIYDKTYTHLDMPFDKLLIEVNPEFSGFNIIRHHNGEYSGRCYYINLDGNMQELYNYLHC